MKDRTIRKTIRKCSRQQYAHRSEGPLHLSLVSEGAKSPRELGLSADIAWPNVYVLKPRRSFEERDSFAATLDLVTLHESGDKPEFGIVEVKTGGELRGAKSYLQKAGRKFMAANNLGSLRLHAYRAGDETAHLHSAKMVRTGSVFYLLENWRKDIVPLPEWYRLFRYLISEG